MIITHYNRSLDDPPGIPPFYGHQKPSNCVQVLTNAMSEMTKNIASIGTVPNKPDSVPSDLATTILSGKVANLRANYLQQLCDLHGLFDCDAITQSEFAEQKSISWISYNKFENFLNQHIEFCLGLSMIFVAVYI